VASDKPRIEKNMSKKDCEKADGYYMEKTKECFELKIGELPSQPK